jgi:Mlc titration factor MtfA (ptsG expression regulator)
VNLFKRVAVRYILHRYALAHDLWHDTTAKLTVLHAMTAVDKAHLRELTTVFLHKKNIFGAHGHNVSPDMALTIAVQACLPVLRLGINCLAGWTDIIVYPSAFKVNKETQDNAGVIHQEQQLLIGESWSHGPVILSWDEVERDRQDTHSGRNVIIHEIAHKLDMLNGNANGFPPLHQGMDAKQWSVSLSNAYQSVVERVDHHHRPCINPYAATNPAEFFAVISEYFFCQPETLQQHFLEVYQQLVLYYRQNPLMRLS